MVWYTARGVRSANVKYRIQYRTPIVDAGVEAGSNAGGAGSDSGDDEGPRLAQNSETNERQVALTRARLRWLSAYLVLRRGLQAEPLSLGEANNADAHFRCFERELVLLLKQRA